MAAKGLLIFSDERLNGFGPRLLDRGIWWTAPSGRAPETPKPIHCPAARCGGMRQHPALSAGSDHTCRGWWAVEPPALGLAGPDPFPPRPV